MYIVSESAILSFALLSYTPPLVTALSLDLDEPVVTTFASTLDVASIVQRIQIAQIIQDTQLAVGKLAYCVITGDTVNFNTTADNGAVVTITAVPVVGSGLFSISDMPVCVVGDESEIMAPGTYINGAFVGGVLTATISSLIASQKSTAVKSNGSPVILASGNFKVSYKITTPAINPSGTADPTPPTTGTGYFITNNALTLAF